MPAQVIYTCTGIDKSIWRKQDHCYPARLLRVRIPPTMNDQDKANGENFCLLPG